MILLNFPGSIDAAAGIKQHEKQKKKSLMKQKNKGRP